MEEIEYLCDYIVIMDKGEIIANGTYDELINKIDLVEFIEIEYNNEFNDDVVNEIKKRKRLLRLTKTTLTITGVYYLLNLLLYVLPLTRLSVFLGLIIDKKKLFLC